MSDSDGTADLRSQAAEATSAFLEAVELQARATERMVARMAALERRLDALAPQDQAPATEDPATPEDHVDATIAPDRELPGWLEDPRAPSRWRQGAAKLLHAPRSCAVCQRDSPRQAKRELSRSGWAINGQCNLCPDCRSAGWHVSASGGVPFRQPRPTAT
jgi:hypothetical protein